MYTCATASPRGCCVEADMFAISRVSGDRVQAKALAKLCGYCNGPTLARLVGKPAVNLVS